MTAYVVGWTKPRDIFPTQEVYPTHAEAEAALALHRRIDPNATIAPLHDSTEEKKK